MTDKAKDWQPPAFPDRYAQGMTLRDWFAGMALQYTATVFNAPEAAEEAYSYADAMMKERAKPNDN